MDFIENDEKIRIEYEDDRPPFEIKLMGVLKKDDEGFYRFHPEAGAVITQKHCRVLADKLSELNS